MHGHSHGHSHNQSGEADWITNMGAVGEAIEGAANFFYGATVYNTLYELTQGKENENDLGPIMLGMMLGLISLGGAYVHRKLDILHQDFKEEPHCHNHTAYAAVELDTAAKPLSHAIEINSATTSSEQKQKLIAKSTTRLTACQRFNLFSDAVSHTLGRAGLLTGIVDGIASTFSKTVLPPAVRGGVQLGSTLFGMATSASGIRTCWHAMLKLNQQKAAEQQHQCQSDSPSVTVKVVSQSK